MFRWSIIAMFTALLISFLGFSELAGISKNFAIVFLILAVILAEFGFIFRKEN